MRKRTKYQQMNNNTEAKIIQVPKILDSRGNLSFIENMNQLPFQIERVYWIYDVPGGERRGGHAFKQQEEVIIALSGSLDIVVNTGNEEQRFYLNRSYSGLYIPGLLWRHMENFSTNAVVMVLSNGKFDEGEYIRDFEQYKQLR